MASALVIGCNSIAHRKRKIAVVVKDICSSVKSRFNVITVVRLEMSGKKVAPNRGPLRHFRERRANAPTFVFFRRRFVLYFRGRRTTFSIGRAKTLSERAHASVPQQRSGTGASSSPVLVTRGTPKFLRSDDFTRSSGETRRFRRPRRVVPYPLPSA